jgi:hypothetical protein
MTFGFVKHVVVAAVALSVVGCGGPETLDADEATPEQGEVTALDVCSNTENLSHCETVVCGSGYLYRNYNASTDDFSDPYNTVYSGQTLNVRNAPYRRYGPRGVRVFNSGIWGFVSANCVSGGF